MKEQQYPEDNTFEILYIGRKNRYIVEKLG